LVDSSVERCPLSVICPVVFIPGIMGSRLRNARTKNVVWDPGVGGWDQFWHTLDLAMSGAKTKREMLVGRSGSGFSPSYLEVAHGRRGWKADNGFQGLLATYSPFVNWLNQDVVTRINGCVVMIRFVVVAYPYNWTNSNLGSAAGVGEAVAWAASQSEEIAQRLSRQTIKPLIVTHSMGGLVSRAYTQTLGNAGDVQGVIHGAMPTHGSPELYKRIRGGFEGGTRFILGKDQEQVTATAANMPGPLELAPNRVYQDVAGHRKWLRALDGVGNLLHAWPNADPYSEIYANAAPWYKLVQSSLLDPGGNAGRAWSGYVRQVAKAKNFHAGLEGSSFHPNTRMFYGTERKTRDHVAWKPMERFAGAYPLDAEYRITSGRTNLRGYHPERGVAGGRTFGRTLQMEGPKAKGDGTVQAGSGIHVDQMSVPIADGFEHQGAFDSRNARKLTVDWLTEMVKEAIA
jgi:hypothetical protein